MKKLLTTAAVLLLILFTGPFKASALTIPMLKDLHPDNGGVIHFMAGADESALGIISRDSELGLPRWSLGVNFGMGLTYRYYVPIVRKDDVDRASLDAIISGGEGTPTYSNAVRRNLDTKLFPYIGVLTSDGIIPGAVGGVSYDMSNAEGRGWSFNAEVISHPIARMMPVPSMGFSYSF